jgi:nucleotide-binding universal stress UspA family protein
MSFKNILVHVDDQPHLKQRLDVVIDLARRFDAHVSGIYVVPESWGFVHRRAGYAPTELNVDLDEIERGRANEARSFFEDYTAGLSPKPEWRQQQGLVASTVALHARYADLVIVSQAGPATKPGLQLLELPADVAMTAGRPVLVVPYMGNSKPPGAHVLVAWNASREATRAVSDAMPLLQGAKQVTVLAVNPQRGISGHGDVPGADISLNLARHGVKAEAAQTVASDGEVGDVILSRAADLGADLIVIGAYGRSRMSDLILGGVTRHLLTQTSIPILMSH